jgi:hypothetical protein
MEHFFASKFTAKKKNVKKKDFVASYRHNARKNFQRKVSTSLTAAGGQTHGHHVTVMI